MPVQKKTTKTTGKTTQSTSTTSNKEWETLKENLTAAENKVATLELTLANIAAKVDKLENSKTSKTSTDSTGLEKDVARLEVTKRDPNGWRNR